MGAVGQAGTRGSAAPQDHLIDGRYRVLAELGEGAMASVYRVADGSGDRPLALKRLRIDWSNPERAAHALLRFRREFHTMAQFQHPHIVRVFDFGQDADGAFYTMELIEGDELGERAPVDPHTACAWLRDLASALAFLHARRVLHRDVAPRNVRLTTEGRAKLIDFGVLATFGVAGVVAGTPTCVPPEAVRGLPLDHRADLYGLGALAYFLLTGGHPYPAHHVYELEAMWAKGPPPPSAYRDGISPELDALVMSLISLDPLGRPSSAAEVIDRLTGIGELDADPEAETATGWLQSATLVGRQREMEAVRTVVRSTAGSQGAALTLEAPTGLGKSRLLREAGLEAQLAGATVLRAAGLTVERGPYGLLAELAGEALAACPEEALAAAEPHVAVIGRALPELAERLPHVTLAEPHPDPAQERVEQQRHLLEWLANLSRRRPLVLLVDDVQRSDESSAAVLAALAHAAAHMRLALIAGLRTDEPIRAPGALAAIRDAARRQRIRGLSEDEVEDLVRALFGDVPHADVLARTMHRVGGGGPLHCTELARHFVDRGVLRYDGGTWHLPPRIDETAVPQGLREAMDARIEALPPEGRRLGEALAVQGGDMPLELCVRLADDDEEAVFAALDGLMVEEVLLGSGDNYRFRHDGLREALLRNMDDERRRVLHRRAGEAIASSGQVSAEREAQVGWHFHRGGDSERAAAYLERAGRRLYEVQSFSDSIAPLEAALRIREQQGAAAGRRIELRQMLMRAGVLCDREVILRYADETIAQLRDVSGMASASRMAPYIGRLPALALGLGWAWLRWLSRMRDRGPNPIASLTTLITLVNYTASAYSLSFDLDRLRPLVRMLDPLAALRGMVPRGAYLMTENFLSMATGHFRRVRRNIDEMLVIVERDEVTPLSDIDRRMALGGAYYMRASIAATVQDPTYERDLQRLEQLDLRFFEAAARMDQLFYHRLRGEEERAEKLREETEVMFVQLGNVWVFESQLQWISALAYASTRDVVGLKRCVEGLDRLVREGYRLESFATLTRAEYLRERGSPAEARTLLETLLAELHPDQHYVRQHAVAALAEAHLALGEAPEARRVATSGLERSDDPEVGLFPVHVRCSRALALAEAADGDHEAAAGRLDAMIARVIPLDSPSLAGGLHEARARVALHAGDEIAFATHYAETESWFRSTRNPALVARLERLGKAHRDRGSSQPPRAAVGVDAVTAVDAIHPASRIASALGTARGPSERALRALDLLLDETAAASGFLFLADGSSLELVAPVGVSVPEGLLAALDQVCAAARAGTATSLPRTHQSLTESGAPGAWLPVVLALEGTSHPEIIGVAALIGGSLPLVSPDPALVRELARLLKRAPDAEAVG
ncbi:MAG: protein kinase domain-containing protein [Myxococcota bacterium]